MKKTKWKVVFASASLLAFGFGGASAWAEDEAFLAPSGEYETDEAHRYISFSYRHQGLSRPQLRWGDWNARLNWDAEEPANSSVSVVIDATSIDSGVEVFNGHIQDERFFDAANHPEITFVSTSVDQTSEDEGEITGDLTIKGVTKPVTLNVNYNSALHDERGGRYKIGFSATASVKRSDFGMDTYVPFVGDDVEIVIEAEFVKPAE